jgi:hypothetical protein
MESSPIWTPSALQLPPEEADPSPLCDLHLWKFHRSHKSQTMGTWISSLRPSLVSTAAPPSSRFHVRTARACSFMPREQLRSRGRYFCWKIFIAPHRPFLSRRCTSTWLVARPMTKQCKHIRVSEGPGIMMDAERATTGVHTCHASCTAPLPTAAPTGAATRTTSAEADAVARAAAWTLGCAATCAATELTAQAARATSGCSRSTASSCSSALWSCRRNSASRGPEEAV